MRRIVLAIFFHIFLIQNLQAQDCHHSHGRTQNQLIPDFKFTLAPREITESSAVSFLGEGGRRNFRFNGTYGLLINSENRFKISGEFLQQKLGYHFSAGKTRRWMRQFATGATFQHDFCHPYLTSGQLSAYCSYAPSRQIGRERCNEFIFTRRIAGSTGYGVEMGTTLRLWQQASLNVDASYDRITYHRRLHSRKHVEGFGGSIGFHQQLLDHLGFDLRAEFKRPYNYYRVAINWSHPCLRGASVGLFGSHTRGKSRLPSNTIAGIEINYVFSDFFNSSCFEQDRCQTSYCSQELASWVMAPAVYMPEVLAIAEEARRRVCIGVPTSVSIAPFSASAPGAYLYDVSPFFSNSSGTEPLVYSATGLPPGATINPLTGVISGTNPQDGNTYTVTVVATNGCSSTSQTFTMSFLCPALTSVSIAPFSACAPGAYLYDVSPFFSNSSGTEPLVYSATGLPPGATINPLTGVISGTNPQDGNTYTVTVVVTNGCSSTSQTFTMSFLCPAPTSSSISDQPAFLPPGTPYSVNVVASSFVSPCGIPMTFTATGLPAGTTIDPVSGLISGIVPSPPNPVNVTVTGTTACGQTSQSFLIYYFTE
ncbi:Uncharacterized protein PHSC3_001168 [Chlamydiales bacterium STE3]|nr:Uncharacterized protein PHSC3_001168 [Chlamydiales bacterium STE3]